MSLDFEKPIIDLETRLMQMKEIASKKGNSFSKEVLLLEEKIIADGMLPKMENCFYALKGGVQQVRLGKPEMLHNKDANFTTLRL